jgi:hypothetical protein
MKWTTLPCYFTLGLKLSGTAAPAALNEVSDCVGCQAGGRVAHMLHSLWDRGKNPSCGLVDNALTPRRALGTTTSRGGSI